MSRKRTQSLGVDWTLPGRKRRFATTTAATSFLIQSIASQDDTPTWRQLLDRILYDPEAKAVAQTFIDAGHGNTAAISHVVVSGWGADTKVAFSPTELHEWMAGRRPLTKSPRSERTITLTLRDFIDLIGVTAYRAATGKEDAA